MSIMGSYSNNEKCDWNIELHEPDFNLSIRIGL